MEQTYITNLAPHLEEWSNEKSSIENIGIFIFHKAISW